MIENRVYSAEELCPILAFLARAYDVVRVVDPRRRAVVDFCPDLTQREPGAEAALAASESWVGCPAAKADATDAACVQVKAIDGRVYLATALPVQTPAGKLVVELFSVMSDGLKVSLQAEQEAPLAEVIGHLHDRAVKDSLTGLFNRRYADERLPVELARCRAEGSQLSLLMGDLDHFKEINDRHGHAAGDEVLRCLARLLTDCVREGRDWVARWGGEEFLVCLPDTGCEGAVVVAERMRQRLAESNLQGAVANRRVTVSFGVAGAGPEDRMTAAELVQEADRRLYAAKQGGRNRVEA